MLKNSEMIPNRYAKWARARRVVAFIQSSLDAGRTVYLTTYTHRYVITANHRDLFKATKDGAFMASGKKWLSIDGCRVAAQ